MASIPYLSGDLSERGKVALASRAAAVAIASLAVALLSLFEIKTPDSSLGAPVVNAILLAPPTPAPTPPVVRPHRRETTVATSAAAAEGDEEWPHLWTYDARGRIVFRTDEQLARCTLARRNGREEADCPSSSDRTPMVSRER
ncbi:MAG: hypothetical protein R3C27_08300 [Hyphomonadaceae bacterium]